MEHKLHRQLTLNAAQTQSRPFVYRSVDDADTPHPFRRSTDRNRSPQPTPAEAHGHATLLQFRVCLKLN